MFIISISKKLKIIYNPITKSPSLSSIKVLLVKQKAHFDFPLILFFEIKTNFFGNVILVCLLCVLQ